MPVFTDSRYAPGILIKVIDSRGGEETERSFIYEQDVVSPDVDIQEIHTVEAGERLDQIASRFTQGKSHLWWVIGQVNEIFGFPLFIKPGTKLKIPTQEVFQEAESGARELDNSLW